MGNVTITPTVLIPDQTPTNLTALSATTTVTGGNLGVIFANTGIQLLIANIGSTATTATVSIGTTVLGQAVSSFAAETLTTTAISSMGPFHSALDQPGTTNVIVTFSQATAVTCGLLQLPGVY